MTNVKAKEIVRYRITGSAESHSRTLLKVRDLVDVSDEPEERGGTNEGFAPTEFFLGSLLACSNVISHKIAAKNDINLMSYELSMDTGFNRLGVTLQEEIDLPFPDIKLRIEATTDASDEKLEILKRDLPRFCPIAKMIEAAGTSIETEWVFHRP
jgi:putative redox protein